MVFGEHEQCILPRTFVNSKHSSDHTAMLDTHEHVQCTYVIPQCHDCAYGNRVYTIVYDINIMDSVLSSGHCMDT